MTKAPTPTEMSKGQVTTQTTPQKSSIKQRLRTDLGRSVGVTKATQEFLGKMGKYVLFITLLKGDLSPVRTPGVPSREYVLRIPSVS